MRRIPVAACSLRHCGHWPKRQTFQPSLEEANVRTTSTEEGRRSERRTLTPARVSGVHATPCETLRPDAFSAMSDRSVVRDVVVES